MTKITLMIVALDIIIMIIKVEYMFGETSRHILYRQNKRRTIIGFVYCFLRIRKSNVYSDRE